MDENIFDEDGALTREFLLSRGICCESNCKNCPYKDSPIQKEIELEE